MTKLIAQKLKKIPAHFLLVSIFFYTHKLNEYFELILVKHSLKLLGYWLLLSIAFFITGKLLFKNSIKAAYWASILLIIFFFFGFLQDILRSAKPVSFLASYSVLLPAIVICTAWFTYTTYKRKTLPVKTTLFLNCLFLFFVIAEAGQFAYKKITNAGNKNNIAYQNPDLHVKLQVANSTLKPDIFFIVFDEYTSSVSLKKYLKYDNSSLDSSLLANGFYIVKNSKANYNSTPFSLGSTFNLDYFHFPLEHTPPLPKSLLKAEYSFSKSRIPELLEKQGYAIKNIGLLGLQNYPSPSTSFFQKKYESAFYEETLWGRVQKEIGWHILLKFPEWLKNKIRTRQVKEITSYTDNYIKILAELGKQTNTPKFVYGHIFLPHRPYYLNAKGEYNNLTINDKKHSSDSLYLEQLKFCNKWIDSLASASNRSFARPRIVIIEGDHGFRDADDNIKLRDRELMNLSAIYFSDKNYTALYDSISPVNNFRVIFNKYFHTNLPVLKDSTILLY